MVARRLAGYAVAMEVARRPEGPEVNGDLRKTVSHRSLVPSRELKRKGYSARGRPERRGARAREHAVRATAANARGRPVTTRHMRVIMT